MGLGAFVFVVAPSYDPVMVIMLTQFVGFVPALMQLRRVKRPTEPGDEEVPPSSLLLLLSSLLSSVTSWSLICFLLLLSFFSLFLNGHEERINAY